MRLRIEAVAPLPEIKVWYSPDTRESPANIYDLKDALCLQIPALKLFGVAGRHVVLSLDSFDLLDDSPLDVLRDGDLISIKVLQSAQLGLTKKRKAEREGEKHRCCSSSPFNLSPFRLAHREKTQTRPFVIYRRTFRTVSTLGTFILDVKAEIKITFNLL